MSFRTCSLGMVTGPHPLTADAGLEMLQAGGNAFDAAVAAAFTEAVVEPSHNGVAGYGGAAVCFVAAEGAVECVDFNTEAPAAARPDMYPIEPHPQTGYFVPGALHKYGAASIGVPGIVAGLEELHRCWGTLPVRRILAPAIRAAREGWEVNAFTHQFLAEERERITGSFPVTAELLYPDGRVLARGDRMTNPDLADLLEQLSFVGLRDFYEGETAVRITSYLQRSGGLLDLADMAGYQARHVPTTQIEYRGQTLHTPPVGCGGVTSFQMLKVIEKFDLTQRRPGTAAFFHLFAEVMKPCWRSRLETLGDPAFTGVSEIGQLDEDFIRRIRDEVEQGLREPKPGKIVAPEPMHCTSHLCAADAAGNVVSLTQTHGGHFGSMVTVPGTGLTFGHGMGRFEPRPGWPNSIAPGKRPLHNMAPILTVRDGGATAAYGTPGGRTIVNNQAYFSLCLWAYGLDLAAAFAQPRLHCEEAEPMKLEERAGDEPLTWLRSLGHQVTSVARNGGPASGILINDDGDMDGAVDPRGEGKVSAA